MSPWILPLISLICGLGALIFAVMALRACNDARKMNEIIKQNSMRTLGRIERMATHGLPAMEECQAIIRRVQARGDAPTPEEMDQMQELLDKVHQAQVRSAKDERKEQRTLTDVEARFQAHAAGHPTCAGIVERRSRRRHAIKKPTQ